MQVETTTISAPSPRDALPDVGKRAVRAVANVSAGALSSAFRLFLEEFDEVLSAAPTRLGDFDIEEVELALAVGAEGSFRIAASNADASIKLTLRRRPANTD
jgi:hypothetical protein